MVRSPKIDQWSSGSHIRERTLQLMLQVLQLHPAGSQLFPLIKLAKKLKAWGYKRAVCFPYEFPLIKLAKKLKVCTITIQWTIQWTIQSSFPLIKLAKKLKGDIQLRCISGQTVSFPLIKLAKKLKEKA